jgi:peptidoglycan/LPS O-acetylase OafA/YrhL
MTEPAVSALGWLVFAIGIGVILIAVLPRKTQVHSPTRRAAGVASGLVFCLLACVVIVPGLTSSEQEGLAIAAVVATAASWYLGRHARKMDRMARKHR